MQELKALKPFRIGGQWLAEGDDVPFVEGFDYEKAERKGFLEEVDGEEVVNPLPVGVQRAQPVTNGSEEQEKLVLLNQNLSAELTQARAEISGLEMSLTESKSQLAAAEQQYQDKVTEAGEASAKLVDLQGELVVARSVTPFPEDALARLEGVKGIGAELAKLAFKALTEVPAATTEAK